MVAVLAGCTVGDPVAVATPAVSTAGTTAVDSSTGWARVVLRFDEEVVAVSLADTASARQFAAMLPLDLDLRDPMGQAKSGQLPSPIDIAGADRVTDPAVGEMYYWPDSATIAIFYDDLGQSVPPPGMVRLGTWMAAWTRSPTPETGSGFALTWPTAPASDSVRPFVLPLHLDGDSRRGR